MPQVLIAIVDDEEPVRDATKLLVRSLGYHASTFAASKIDVSLVNFFQDTGYFAQSLDVNQKLPPQST